MTAGILHAFASLSFPAPTPSTVPGANIFTSAFILSIGIWGPVVMAFVIGVMPNPRGRYDTLIKQVAFFTNLVVLFILFVAYNQFQNFLPSLQYEENRQWLPAIGAAYHLGVDGPGILMVMLSALVGIISVLASSGIRTRVRSYFVLLLLTQSCVTGAIVAHDLFVLVLFWSAATVPLALLILGWGGPRREAAAWRLAGIAAVTVVYGAIAALRSIDIRHAAANLALVPGGVTALGLAALTPLSITGSVLSLFAGGMASALIVTVFATVPDRAQTRNVQVLSGLAARMPKLAWLTVLAALGVLGVPLMATFTANEMTFFGAFRTQPVGAFAVAAGLALTAIAVAVLIQRVLFGPPNPDAPAVSDSSLSESWFLGLMAGALLWVGIVPGGPKIPGTDSPLFDPGVVNQMVANIPEISSPYGPTTTP